MSSRYITIEGGSSSAELYKFDATKDFDKEVQRCVERYCSDHDEQEEDCIVFEFFNPKVLTRKVSWS